MSRDQNAGQNHNIKPDVKSLERMEHFKYLGTTQINQNFIRVEIESSLKSGNACCHKVQDLLSSILLTKHKKIKKYRTIIFLDVLHGCETWSLIFTDEVVW